MEGTIHKGHPNIQSYDNYVGKVSMNGEEYYVRFTVTNQSSESGIHSYFVSNVELYEKTADSLSQPITTRTRGTINGIVDAKLQQFFNSAKFSENSIREYSIIGVKGAASLDAAEEVATRMDNLKYELLKAGGKCMVGQRVTAYILPKRV